MLEPFPLEAAIASQLPQSLAIAQISLIAQLLKIPQHLIVGVECWAYVVFVHRRNVGGQFLSDRKLRPWQNAVACQIQNCSTWQQLRQVWLVLDRDYNNHKKQYGEESYSFLCQFWAKHWDLLWNGQEIAESAIDF